MKLCMELYFLMCVEEILNLSSNKLKYIKNFYLINKNL